jgi:hypothetical protein
MQYACSLATIDGSIPGARTAAADDATDDNMMLLPPLLHCALS